MPTSQEEMSKLAQELTEFLRSKLGDSVSITGDISALKGGFDTDTYALSIDTAPMDFPSDLVLRLFRHAREANRVIKEATIQNAAASGGHAVPSVPIDSTGELIIGRPFFLMERFPGINMGESLMQDQTLMQQFPGIIAKLQEGIHKLDTTKLRKRLDDVAGGSDHMKPTRMIGDITGIAEATQLPDLLELNQWLITNYPEQPENPSICHGDLHPNNILVDDGKVTGIIDWATTMFTHPEYDIAVTRTILSIGPPGDIGVSAEELNKLLEWANGEYMKECHALQTLDDSKIDYYSVLRVGHAYAKVLGKRHGSDLPYVAHDGYAWDRPDMFEVVTRIIGETTGIKMVSA